MFILSQILGIIGIIVTIISLQFKEKEKLLLIQSFSAILTISALALVGGFGGSLSQIVGMIRKFTFYFNAKNKRKNSLFLLLLFISLVIIIAIFTWEGLVSILPVIAVSAVTYGLWQDNPITLRIFCTMGNIGFGIYGIITTAYTTSLLELVVLIATIISIIRIKKTTK